MTNKSILKRKSPNRARRPAAARRRLLGEDVQLRLGPLVRVADVGLLWAATAGPTPSARSNASTSPASWPRRQPLYGAVAHALPPQLRRCPSPRKRLPAAALPVVGRPRLVRDDDRALGGARGPPSDVPTFVAPAATTLKRGRFVAIGDGQRGRRSHLWESDYWQFDQQNRGKEWLSAWLQSSRPGRFQVFRTSSMRCPRLSWIVSAK
jgi:hypothetical protein